MADDRRDIKWTIPHFDASPLRKHDFGALMEPARHCRAQRAKRIIDPRCLISAKDFKADLGDENFFRLNPGYDPYNYIGRRITGVVEELMRKGIF